MPNLVIPLSEHLFKIQTTFSKVSSNISKKVNALIDTGASETCVSFSLVQDLGISPAGPFEIVSTASDFGFSLPYPIQLTIGDGVSKITSCSVCFRPTALYEVRWATKELKIEY